MNRLVDDGASEIEAKRIAPLVDHRRLRRAREIRGFTQGELLQRAGNPISAPALSQLERGVTRPSPSTLIALADAVSFPIGYFASRLGRGAADPEPAGYFRSLRSTSARDRKRALGHVFLLHDLVMAIEARLRLPEVNLPRALTDAATPRPEVEEIAASVRARFGLPPGPFEDVVRTLERHGAVVVRLSIGITQVDAFSVTFDDRPLVVLTSDKLNRVRSRFDAAHELGHAVMHRDVTGWEREAEQQAHWFSAAMLMPAETIAAQLPATADWRRLLDLKAEWKVSIAALLKRAKTLDMMSDHTYTNAMKVMSMRGWRRREPGDDALGPPEAPVLLDAALARLRGMGVSLADLAKETALPLDDVMALVAESADHRPRLDL
jgi:Zn-dependent peptidase ImmA (M78 family)/transcriptional regulator with XRE-family HTH domain